MTFQKLISGIKLFTLTGCFVLSTSAFSQKNGTEDQPDNSRVKLEYKQTHGLDFKDDGNLFADGFKLKMGKLHFLHLGAQKAPKKAF